MLVILQSYVPHYRRPFFEELSGLLALQGVTLRVVAGSGSGEQALRNDAIHGDPEWLSRGHVRTLTVGAHEFGFFGALPRRQQYDAIVAPLQGTSVDTWRALLRQRGRRNVGVWGHVDSYTAASNSLDRAAETLQMRLAARTFAYTASGARCAVDRGVDEARVTTVLNTIDTTALEAALGQVDAVALERFRDQYGLSGCKVYCYIGGLDRSKRVDFLATALDNVWATDRSVRLLVAGSGADASLLGPAESRGQVIRWPNADTQLKAVLLSSAQGVVCPGRIGLLAVDALVARRPVLTTAWPFHAPEAEYLTEGQSRLTLPAEPEDFARSWLVHSRTWSPPAGPWPFPAFGQMVSVFAEGCLDLVASR